MWHIPPTNRLFDATEATWPAAERREVGGWTLCITQGAGKRVSSATQCGGGDPAEAERLMVEAGLPPLFMLRGGEDDLDRDLAARGYQVIDPVTIYAGEVAHLAREASETLHIIEGNLILQAMREVWAAGNITAPRLAVMERAAGPKCYLMGRDDDRATAAAFVACDGKIAMLHALEVAPGARRAGMGAAMTRAAARWARRLGAETLALMTTDANTAANALYRRLGMQVAGHYHYRILATKEPQT
ncbi:GNAT family N-acetyltransferase [Halovulum sp. GXIMD14793]